MIKFRRGSRGEKQAQLEQDGYRVIGEGRYGVVLESSNSREVVKLFSAEDTAYRAFVDLAQNNPNPHFPHFGRLVVTPCWTLVRMDRLEHLKDKQDFKHPIQVYLGCRGDSSRALACNDFGIEPFREVEKNSELKLACDLIISELLNCFDLDIHEANFMTRGGDVVIVDPVACR